MLMTLPLLAMVISSVAYFGTIILLKLFTNASNLQRVGLGVVVTGLVAVAMTSTLTGMALVILAPFIVATVLGVITGIVLSIFTLALVQPLQRRGYLGNINKWMYELQDDAVFQAARVVTPEQKVREVAQMSSDAQHFRNQLIKQAEFPDPEADES